MVKRSYSTRGVSRRQPADSAISLLNSPTSVVTKNNRPPVMNAAPNPGIPKVENDGAVSPATDESQSDESEDQLKDRYEL